MNKIPLIVVGGGIGGLAAALAISKIGRPVLVLEKAEEFAEVGAGLQLAPNATRMLDCLGLLDELRANATFPKFLVMKDARTDQLVTALDLGKKFVQHFGYPYILVHRADLLSVELAACRANSLITLESSKQVTAIQELSNALRVECADGTSYECEALIGADGLWSTVRKYVHDDGDPICSAHVAFRGTIPISEIPPGSDLENMTIWIGPDLHFVQYQVHGGELFNQVAVFKSHRYRSDSEDWGSVAELDEHFTKMCPHLQQGISKIGRHRRWAMFDRLPIPNWTKNRITLMGDAAHPMLQYIAQGACQALEDAIYLGQQIGNYPDDIVAAFHAYQAPRIPRTARAQTTSRFFGDVMHIGGAGIALRNALLARRASDDFDYFEYLYGYK